MWDENKYFTLYKNKQSNNCVQIITYDVCKQNNYHFIKYVRNFFFNPFNVEENEFDRTYFGKWINQ